MVFDPIRQDFEGIDTGGYPSGWVTNGSDDQAVVDSTAADGEQSLRITGTHGGCWEALANAPFGDHPGDQPVRISGAFRPAVAGAVGCHDNMGSIQLGTSAESWSTGSTRTLVRFRDDRTIAGSGLDLGSFEPGEWVAYAVRYAYDPDGGSVELAYAIDGEDRGTATVDAMDDETSLAFLTAKSGDFTAYWDEVRVVPADDVTATSSPTSTGTEPRTATMTTTDAVTTTGPAPSPVGFADATRVGAYRIEGDTYHVYREIPGEPTDRYAFTDANDVLLGADAATDVAVAYTFAESYAFDSTDRLEYTTEQHAEWERLESMARTAELLALLSGAIALAKLDPLSAVSNAVEAVQSAVDWAQADMNEPYERQFAKMATASNTAAWADREAADPEGSLLSFSEDALDVGQFMLDASGAVSSVSEIATSADAVRDVVRAAVGVTDSVPASDVSGVDDLRTTSYTVVAGLAVDAAVDGVVNVAETQAKQAGLGAGSTGARKALLNEIVTLETRLREGRLGPMGVVHLQSLRQTDYQLEAAAWHGIAALERELSTGTLGPAYDALLNADDLAERFRETAAVWENLSLITMAATGREFGRALDRYERSLNAAEFGEQQLFDNR